MTFKYPPDANWRNKALPMTVSLPAT